MKSMMILAGTLLLTAGLARAGDQASVTQTKHASLLGTPYFTETGGEQIFNGVCAACHMPDAKGGTGAGYYPALAKNEKLMTSSYPVMMVMNGHGGMPSFRDTMTDAQIAAVVGYVRTHFGNSYADPVSVDEVKQAREAK